VTSQLQEGTNIINNVAMVCSTAGEESGASTSTDMMTSSAQNDCHIVSDEVTSVEPVDKSIMTSPAASASTFNRQSLLVDTSAAQAANNSILTSVEHAANLTINQRPLKRKHDWMTGLDCGGGEKNNKT